MRNKNSKKDLSKSKPKPKPKGKGGAGYSKPKPFKSTKPYKPKELKEDDGTVRLNRFIANAGVCSRREADELIATGVVEVNGQVVTAMGYKVMPTDEVRFDGRQLQREKKEYFLLNKPKGFISTTNDEKARKTVLDLLVGATKSRIYPVGRLDRPTTGLLLITNDGELTKKLTHPSHKVKKIYHVKLDKKLSTEDKEKILKGLRFEEGIAEVDNLSFIEGKPRNEVGIELHIGWNRIIRRIFGRLGYEVTYLDRVYLAGLTKKNLKRGDYRRLTEQEVINLRML